MAEKQKKKTSQAKKKTDVKKAGAAVKSNKKNTGTGKAAASKNSGKSSVKKGSVTAAKTTKQQTKTQAESKKRTKTAAAAKNQVKASAGTSAKKRNKSSGKTAGKITAFILIAACIVFAGFFGHYYYTNVKYYQEHFFSGTWINGTDCSSMTAEEAKQTIQDKLNDYSFTFTDHEGRSSTVTAEEIDLVYSDDGEVDDILHNQKSLSWILRKEEEDSYSVTSGYTYDREKLQRWIRELPCVGDGIPPADAYEYMGEDGFWHIEPETEGDQLDESALEERIISAVDNAQTEENLEDQDLFLKPSVRADDETLTAGVKEKNDVIQAAIDRAARIDEITDVSLTFNSYIDKVYLDGELLREMIVDDENGDPVLDEEQIKDWVRTWAAERGLEDETNLFVTHGGRLMNVGNGVLGGWQLDVEATAEKACRAVSERDSGVLFPVTRDGNGELQTDATYVEINIKKQKMWYYQDGEELVDTPVVTGDIIKGYDTPTNGIWYIYYKTTDYTMHGPRMANGDYEYVTFVSYWMPFNGQIGIHDMAQRENFGGEIYKGNGSHGCINTPLENVEIIYRNAGIGTPVVVHS